MVDSPFFTPAGEQLPVSAEAQTMLDAGAAPHQPDVNALLAQLQALQSRVDTLQTEAGIPSNPVEFALNNLRDHVNARKAATPYLDVTEVSDLLKNATPTARDAELLSLAVDDLVSANGSQDLQYLRQLARDVRKAVLVNGGQSATQAALTVRGVSA